MSTTTSEQVSVVLKTPDDWDQWIQKVKTKAIGADIWEYINPDTEKGNLPELSQPPLPMPKDVNPNKKHIYQLDEDEKDDLKHHRQIHKINLARYLRQETAYKGFLAYIQENISSNYFNCTMGLETPYEMLAALKQRIAPSDEARELELINKYNKLKKLFSKNQDLENWIQEWEDIYQKGKEIDLPEVQGKRPVYDFLNSVSSLDPEFSSFWRLTTQTSSTPHTLYQILDEFRKNQRVVKARKGNIQYSAYATFKGESLPVQKQEDRSGSTRRRPSLDCLCGQKHYWKDCPYLVENKHPQGWQPDQVIQNSITQKLESNPSLRAKVEKALSQRLGTNHRSEEEKAPTAFPTFATSQYQLHNSFILDSGADTHVCNDRSRFQTFREPTEERSLLAGNIEIPIEGYGSVSITLQCHTGPKKVELLNVAYIPSFHTNIVSFRKLVTKGIYWDTRKNQLMFKEQVFCTLKDHYGQWVLEYQERDSQESAFISKLSEKPKKSEATAEVWHRRLGHIGTEALDQLTESAIGAKIDQRGPRTVDCEVCSVSKAHELISRPPASRATSPYEKVHLDLIQMTWAYNSDRWIIHLTCDLTRMQHVITTAHKSLTAEHVKSAILWIQKQYHTPVKIIRMDGESTLTGMTFGSWAASMGIQIETSAPYTPEQNGSAERSGGVILTRARSMRIGAHLPEDMWPEVVKTAAYLLNKTPTRQLGWQTPSEALNQALGKPNSPENIAHLRVYGCRAYPLDKHVPKSRKLEPRAHIGYLVGYESTNIYRIWIPQQKKVINTRDVTFNENLFYNPDEPHLASRLRETVPETYETLIISDQPTQDQLEVIDSESEDETEESVNQNTPLDKQRASDSQSTSQTPSPALPTPEPTPEREVQPQQSSEQPSERDEPHQQSHLDQLAPQQPDQPLTTRVIRGEVTNDNIVEGPRTRRRTEKARKQAYLTVLSSPDHLGGYHAAFAAGFQDRNRLHRDHLPPEPQSWRDLLNHQFREGFLTAASKEYGDLCRRNTFEPKPRTTGIKPLPVRWVFTYRLDQDGYLEKFKARLCVRGDLQKDSPYQDNYAATLAGKIFRAMMAIAAAFDLELWQADAVSAFTNSDMDETVYIEYPEGFKKQGYCLLLRRALYGLRRSPLLWQKDATRSLQNLGLRELEGKSCLFSDSKLMVFFFVDDFCAMCHRKDQQHLEEFKRSLLSRYEMKDLGELRWFLGVRVLRDRIRRKIWLCQDSYIDKVTARFNLTSTAAPKTPMATEELTPHQGKATPQEIYTYQQKVGSILFAACQTRPDIARAAAKLSESMQNPSPSHQAAVNRVISYLYGTRSLAIEYSVPQTTTEDALLCASDAAFAGDSITRKSTEGYLFSMFGGAIDWKSSKQKTVTTSSTEAELLALSHAAKEALWWSRLLQATEFDPENDLQILCDNRQTLRLFTSKGPAFYTKLRHIDIANHWLNQEVDKGTLKLTWIPTARMPADGLTKALPRQQHETFVRLIGLVDIADRLQERDEIRAL